MKAHRHGRSRIGRTGPSLRQRSERTAERERSSARVATTWYALYERFVTARMRSDRTRRGRCTVGWRARDICACADMRNSHKPFSSRSRSAARSVCVHISLSLTISYLSGLPYGPYTHIRYARGALCLSAGRGLSPVSSESPLASSPHAATQHTQLRMKTQGGVNRGRGCCCRPPTRPRLPEAGVGRHHSPLLDVAQTPPLPLAALGGDVWHRS